MDTSLSAGFAVHPTHPDADRPGAGIGSRAWRILLSAAFLTTLVFFIDLRVPRTAIPAIFYTGLIVLVGAAGVPRSIIPAALLFTVLTWLGAIFEPPAPSRVMWLAAGDRAIVTGVIWLAAILMVRRERDMAALDQLTRELARRNRELDQFASVVAHDIRSPLATATLYAELLARRAAQNEQEEADYRAVIAQSLAEMDQLIRELLDATRQAQAHARSGHCDTEQIIVRVLRTMRAEIRSSGAQVTHDPLPVVQGDEGQIRRILQNLIQNSIKYRAPDRPLCVHVSASRSADGGKDEWTFRVTDNGLGISAEQRHRVFERYTQGASPSARQSGIGLGLAVCRQIIERHRGRIWVESAPGGEGSIFCFTLPAA